MSALTNLGYYVIEASDLDAWAKFAEDVVGLQIGSFEPGKSLSLRADQLEQRILLQQGDEDDVVAIGWELDTHEALDEYIERLRRHDVLVEEGDAELAASRRVERVFYCTDPNDLRHEFFVGALYAPTNRPFRSKSLVGEFKTGRLGIGHVVVLCKDPGSVKSVEFYHKVLGLAISDYTTEEVAPGIVVDATFFHAAAGRHHSLATASVPGGKRVEHVLLEVDSMHDVGLAYDRFTEAGAPIRSSIGYHGADGMFSFYTETPSGFGLEFGWGAIVVDDATWRIKRYSKLSEWGHKGLVPAPEPTTK